MKGRHGGGKPRDLKHGRTHPHFQRRVQQCSTISIHFHVLSLRYFESLVDLYHCCRSVVKLFMPKVYSDPVTRFLLALYVDMEAQTHHSVRCCTVMWKQHQAAVSCFGETAQLDSKFHDRFPCRNGINMGRQKVSPVKHVATCSRM